MNFQNIMKQAQSLQKDIMKEKAEIDKKEFSFENELVSIKANGKKEILDIKYKFDDKFDMNSDKEILEEMTMLAINGVNKLIDQETEAKMGKYSNSMPGLF